jgi:hypothetical protein
VALSEEETAQMTAMTIAESGDMVAGRVPT